MRVALVTPWKNAWVPYFKSAFEARGCEFSLGRPDEAVWREPSPDVVLHGWTQKESAPVNGAKNLMFLRRYELFDGGLDEVDWSRISGLICVNDWIGEIATRVFKQRGIGIPVHVIYNGTDTARWTYRERGPGKRIGMACHVHPKKNLPLAAQILGTLPKGYELHIAGEVQDPCTAEYLNHIGKATRRRIIIYGHIPHGQLDFWWEQMNYCLSSSMSEGNPNNVIEAMAKGIKPVIHNWPGAQEQFGEFTFNRVEHAAAQILSDSYDSAQYLSLVQSKFSLANIERVVDLALQ